MTRVVKFSAEADDDRFAIWDYLSDRSRVGIKKADEMDALFVAAALGAAAQPDMHRIGRVEGTREIVVTANYLLIYEANDAELRVLRVLHTSRQWPI